MSLDLDPLCVGVLAHPVTLSWLYLHLFNKALWCFTDMTRLVRCDIVTLSWFYLHLFNKALWCFTDMTRSVRCDNSSASQWLNICSCRCLPLDAVYCCRTLGCSLLGTVGACYTASEVDGVVMGCPATLTLVCKSGLTASG